MLKSILSQKKKVALHVSVLGEVIKGFIGLRDTLKVLNNNMVDGFIQYFEETCTKTLQPNHIQKTCSLELMTNYHRLIQHRRLTLEFQVNIFSHLCFLEVFGSPSN